MKKIIAVVAILLIVGITVPLAISYSNLQMINQGQTYTLKVATITIPKNSGSLKWNVKSSLKPYIEVKNVSLESPSLGTQITLPTTILKTRGWGLEHLSLEVPELNDPKTSTLWKNLRIYFTKDSFEGMNIDSVALSSIKGAAVNIELKQFKVAMTNSSNAFPKNLEVHIGSLGIQPTPEDVARGSSKKEDHATLQDFLFQTESQVKDQKVSWSLKVSGKGSIEHNGIKGTIEPWTHTLSGDANNITTEDITLFQTQMNESMDSFIKASSQALSETLPSPDCITDPDASPPEPTPDDCIPAVNQPPQEDRLAAMGAEYEKLFNNISLFVQKLEWRPLALNVEWKGLNVKDDVGDIAINIDPISWASTWKHEDNAFSQTGNANIKKIMVNIKKTPAIELTVDDMNSRQESHYSVPYRTMIKTYLDYSKTSLSSALKIPSPSDPIGGLISSLSMIASNMSQLPDTSHSEMTTKLIHYHGLDFDGDHKDASFKMDFTDKGITLGINDHFNHTDTKKPEQKFENASIDFQSDLQIPWVKMIGKIRDGNMMGIIESFANEALGLKIKSDIDLGSYWAKLALNIDVGTSMPPLPPPSDPDYQSKAQSALLTAFVEKGRLNASLKIDRFSKIKAYLLAQDPTFQQKMDASATYYKLDPTKDQLTTEIEMKNKSIMINGVVDPMLSMFLGMASAPATAAPLTP